MCVPTMLLPVRIMCCVFSLVRWTIGNHGVGGQLLRNAQVRTGYIRVGTRSVPDTPLPEGTGTLGYHR